MVVRPLLAVLQEARSLLARPGNDFSWSSWVGSEDALREIDALMRPLKHGLRPPTPWITPLFLPTGPIQDVAQSSGWGSEFLAVAAQMDSAVEKYQAEPGTEETARPIAIDPEFPVEILSFRLLGRGPACSGPGGGWSRSDDILYRCANCGDTMPGSRDDYFTCRCHAMHLDRDAFRFGSWYGDENILVYGRA